VVEYGEKRILQLIAEGLSRAQKMRQLPKELQSIDCPDLQRAIKECVEVAAANWGMDASEASDIVIDRLKSNLVSRKSLVSARRYLREIPEQDYGDY